MQNELSPQQLADTKAMLMAQLDSLRPDDLPDKINNNTIRGALKLYNDFTTLLHSKECAVDAITSLNTCIGGFISSIDGTCADYGLEGYYVTELSSFIAKNIDVSND